MSLQKEKREKKILKHKQTWYKQMHVSKDLKLKKKERKKNRKNPQQQQTTTPTTPPATTKKACCYTVK